MLKANSLRYAFLSDMFFKDAAMKVATYKANTDGATRRDLIMGAAGGVMLTSMSSAGQAMTPGSQLNSVEQIIAIEAIKYRKARYAYCIDHEDYEGFGANFTEDAIWDISEATNPRDPATGAWTGVSQFSQEVHQSLMAKAADWPIVGRSNIANTAKRISGASTSAHKLFTPMIDILSDTDARAIWPFEDESYSPTRYANGVGYYHETYSKVGKEWLIKSTKVKRTFQVMRPPLPRS